MTIGHQKILDYLRKSVAKNRVSHGYLFYGPERVGKRRTAIEFAKILQCRETPHQTSTSSVGTGQTPHQSKHGTGQAEGACGVCKNCQDIEKGVHPDLILIQAQEESQEIEISQIRNLRRSFSLSPYFGNYKIAIIEEAHNLNREAANALLKTLEEPRGKAVLILTSALHHLLPKTINSRLQQIKFSLVSSGAMEDYLKNTDLDEKKQKEILKISQGRPEILEELLGDSRKKDKYRSFMKNLSGLRNFDINQRFEYIRKPAESRRDATKFLDGLAIFFRDIFLIKSGVGEFAVNSFLEKELTQLSEFYSKNQLQKILKLLARLNEMISFSNVNSRLCLEVLMLEI